MALTPPTRLGTYEILAPLGAGGMGEVYRARDLRLDREVAVKVLPAASLQDETARARLLREARFAATLNHPNICTVYEAGEAAGHTYIAMELVEGRPLSECIAERPGGLATERVVRYGAQIAVALAHAHARRLVHRDLKSSNVVITPDGRVKVLDFGLAQRAWDPDETGDTRSMGLTENGAIVGTPQYLAPEVLRGGPANDRSDLWALGVVLHEMASGTLPFKGVTSFELASAILLELPAALPERVPAGLRAIIARSLAKEPGERYASANEVRAALEAIAADTPPDGLPAPVASRLARVDVASIAVLPFENRGRDEEDEYFADGITEDVIAQLCKVRTLKVISRTSVMPFKRHRESLQDIASRLQVAHLLEGSVRRVGDRVRIIAQLVDPASGRNLWAETYDRSLEDIFEIQSEVALHIAGALKAELTPNERQRIGREPTRDVRAYELYLRGRQSLVRFNVADMRRSIEYFDRAIELDPEYAPAYVGLTLANAELSELGTQARHEVGARALSAAEKAVALDPELGDAHCALAYARMVFEMDFAAAEAGYKRALELSPGSAFAYDLYGRMCAGLERFDEAVVLQKRAHELDPLVQRADLATTLLRAGRNDEAAQTAAQAIQMEPDSARLHATFGWALFRQGRVEEGLKELEQAVALVHNEDVWLAQLGEAYALAGETGKAQEVLRKLQDPSRPTPASPYHLAYVYTGLGDLERAMDCLELAHRSGEGPVYGIKGSFLLAPLRQHPRFLALMKRMGLR